jgi:hypothetical protein
MRFNDRAMALAGIPDLPVDAFKKEGGKIKLHGGGGGPTTTKSETSNIPEYARPYVERMMGATEKQVYTYGDKGNITGFQPYKPFEGETVAGFTPMQRQAMQGIGGYQLPGQTGAATQMTGYAGLGSMGAGGRYEQQATNPYATQAYMSPYMENALAPQMREAARQSAIQGQQNQAQAVQAGAFGGSRQAIVEAERQRNLGQQQADIYGRGMQSAFEQARQAQQFGAELGLKGYGQGLQAAGQMGALGQQQYGQEMGLLGQQMEIGGKQQQYEQARLNQIIQDYATQQQYPFIQLGTLSNMLRGLPMQASTTQMYQAQPPALQQAVGLAGAGANLYQAMKAEGGAIKEMASGGIASGADPYKLPGMMKKLSDKQLGGKLDQKDTDPETMGIAQAEKQRRDQVRAGVTKMAGGGAVAFAKGGTDEVDNPFNKVKPEDKEAKPEVKKEVKPAPKAAPAKASVSATPYQDMARAQLAALDTLPPEVENVRSSVKELEKRTAGGVEGEMDRQQKLRERFGVDPTKLIAEERARHQEELKLSEEDYRKAQHLRYAQMFARFGSTPGPVLKAALVSINDVVPDLLDDKAKANAVRREIKKAMFELDKSEYQEKKGNLDAASKSHEEAVGRITSLNMELGKMVTETGLKKADITGGMAKSEIAAISGEKQTAMTSSATRYAADKRESGETKRAEMREAAELRKEKERVSRDTNSYLSAMSKWDKENKDDINTLEQAVRFAKNKNEPNIVIMKDQLAKKQQERMAYEAEVRRAFPDARTSSDVVPAGDVDTSNPLLK